MSFPEICRNPSIKGIKVQLNPTQDNPYILIFSCRFYLCNYLIFKKNNNKAEKITILSQPDVAIPSLFPWAWKSFAPPYCKTASSK